MLVSEKVLKALDQRGIHPEFNMSFDGVGWHDWLRGIPGAEKMADLIRKMQEVRPGAVSPASGDERLIALLERLAAEKSGGSL